MFDKILIANRGEIACRVIRTARQLGIKTVALYSDADRQALHVQQADEAIYIGAAPARESYLDADRIIQAALATGAQAIHPGYGFLSENAAFAQACDDADLVFIGPPVPAITAMGSKSAAKAIMEKANVPLVPGYHGEDQSEQVLKDAADQIGYPVLLKAAAGGGGKGMRLVEHAADFDQALAGAKREATNAFGDDTMLVEKYLTQPRHVEIQVFCDNHDNAVYLFERDCSIQRRHQKVIEEAPAPGMSQKLRQQMGEAAVRAAQAIGYRGAGTVEFLLDHDGAFYFMEMNTRLQVEHPVTEMITGQDLVHWQLQVANNESLPLTQDQLQINGHAFEVRIYAEDPQQDFLPVTGHIAFLQQPQPSPHVRIDSGVQAGDDITVYYDPMIAKLIVWDENRDRALARLRTALSEYHLQGITTNVEFLYNIACHQAFAKAELTTRFIENHQQQLLHQQDSHRQQDIWYAALCLLLQQQTNASNTASNSSDPYSPWATSDNWQANLKRPQHLNIQLAGEHHRVEAWREDRNVTTCSQATYRLCHEQQQTTVSGEQIGNQLNATVDGHRQSLQVFSHDQQNHVFGADGAFSFSIHDPLASHNNQDQQHGLEAPMNGTIITLLVEPGSTVTADTPLLVMEAMKMEHTIKAPFDGVVDQFYFQPGELVDGGAELLKLDETPEDQHVN